MNNNVQHLQKTANTIRKTIIEMAYTIRSAHTGGSLSCVDILTTLYFDILHIDPKNPLASDRDRLVFSKAHDCKALYATLAERGFFSKDILKEYESNGGRLPGHSTRHCVPGVEVSAGSLGHGLSLATGMAYAGKIDNKKHRIFAILSDGECDEGSTWEAILFAGHHKLSNLTVIVDYNKLQGFGRTTDILNLEPFAQKWRDFHWASIEVDGHNIEALQKILQKLPFEKDKPSVIIANTTKGFGGAKLHVDKVSSHYKPPTEEEYKEAMETYKI